MRKTEKTVINARLALEQIVLRLKTVTELGDMVHALGPVICVLGSIRAAITGVLPDAGREREQIGTELNGIISNARTNHRTNARLCHIKERSAENTVRSSNNS
jgi:division protein CdvB (Snf7/Vps24/ESCRT-III family)